MMPTAIYIHFFLGKGRVHGFTSKHGRALRKLVSLGGPPKIQESALIPFVFPAEELHQRADGLLKMRSWKQNKAVRIMMRHKEILFCVQNTCVVWIPAARLSGTCGSIKIFQMGPLISLTPHFFWAEMIVSRSTDACGDVILGAGGSQEAGRAVERDAGLLCVRHCGRHAHSAVLRHVRGLAGLAAGAARREGVPRTHQLAAPLHLQLLYRDPATPPARRRAALPFN